MTAQEARQKAETLFSNKDEVELKKIRDLIEQAVNKHRFEIYVESLSSFVSKTLVKDGYLVTSYSFPGNELGYYIKW